MAKSARFARNDNTGVMQRSQQIWSKTWHSSGCVSSRTTLQQTRKSTGFPLKFIPHLMRGGNDVQNPSIPVFQYSSIPVFQYYSLFQHSVNGYQSLNPLIPQSLNSSIPQSLNPSIPQFLNPSIPQFLNTLIP